jgi:hypothetical protein
MSTVAAKKISITVKISVRKAPNKGRVKEVTDVGVFLGSSRLAFRTFAGRLTNAYALAQFNRTGHLPEWQKDPVVWDMYKAWKSVI